MESKDEGQKEFKKRRLFTEKNATPGDGARSLEACLEDIRPHAICVDRTAAAASDPQTQREGCLERFGELKVSTGGKEINQFCPKYFSQVLPFVFPQMVSGPDYFPDQRWRRTHPDAPWVTPDEFIAGMARRAESQFRNDWTAVPIMRSVGFKWKAEHTMCPATYFQAQNKAATKTDAKDYIKALQNLYHHLHHGFTKKDIHRVPINGDMAQLPYATGLTSLERRLAHTCVYLSQNQPGTQALRRIMGHSQFGARVQYGDCIFITISPNEQHSALVLRLMRNRANDPSVCHGEEVKRRLAGPNYPPLEENDETIDLPEYDLRRAAAAQDPYAVVEAYKIQIYLRLMILLGVRMCPDCPRCNDGPMGCQDKFGNNMRPGGGVIGGIPALGGGTEHQGSAAETGVQKSEPRYVCAMPCQSWFQDRLDTGTAQTYVDIPFRTPTLRCHARIRDTTCASRSTCSKHLPVWHAT